jgi:hypothetical protein
MINQFGYLQAPFIGGISAVSQRVVGLPIQSPGIPGQYVVVPIEAVSPRIIPTAAFISPMIPAVHPAASWQTTPFYGGLATQALQGLPAQPFFGVPQTGIQGLPVSQTLGIQGLPIQQGLAAPALQAPNMLGGPLLQSVNWTNLAGLELSNPLLGARYEGLPIATQVLAPTQTPRLIYI